MDERCLCNLYVFSAHVSIAQPIRRSCPGYLRKSVRNSVLKYLADPENIENTSEKLPWFLRLIDISVARLALYYPSAKAIRGRNGDEYDMHILPISTTSKINRRPFHRPLDWTGRHFPFRTFLKIDSICFSDSCTCRQRIVLVHGKQTTLLTTLMSMNRENQRSFQSVLPYFQNRKEI